MAAAVAVPAPAKGKPDPKGGCCAFEDTDDDDMDFEDEYKDLSAYDQNKRLNAWIQFAKGIDFPHWYRRFEKHSHKMPRYMATFLIFFFSAWKYITWFAMILATDTTLQENTPRPITNVTQSCCPAKAAMWVCDASGHTPFQSHPQDFGAGFQISVSSHMISAFALISVVFVPFFAKKGYPVHRVFGRIFVVFWMWHMSDGLIAAIVVLVERGYQPQLYPTVMPDSCGSASNRAGFSLWLYVQFAFLAQCVLDFLVHAVATIQWKASSKYDVPAGIKWLMIINNVITTLHGVGYFILGIVICAVGVSGEADTFDLGEFNGAIEYGVIFIVQCPAYTFLQALNIRYWALKKQDRMGMWAAEHKRSMVFCMAITVITFLANVTFRLAGMGKPVCQCDAHPPTIAADGSCSSHCKGGFPDLTAICWASIEIAAFTYWAVTSAITRKRALAYVYASNVVRRLWGGADAARERAECELARLRELQSLKKTTHADTVEARKLADCIALLEHVVDDKAGEKPFRTAATLHWGELMCCCGARKAQVEAEEDAVARHEREKNLKAMVATILVQDDEDDLTEADIQQQSHDIVLDKNGDGVISEEERAIARGQRFVHRARILSRRIDQLKVQKPRGKKRMKAPGSTYTIEVAAKSGSSGVGARDPEAKGIPEFKGDV